MEILTKGTMFSEPEYLTAKKILEDFSSEPFSDLEHFSAPVSGQTFDAAVSVTLILQIVVSLAHNLRETMPLLPC